MKRNLLLGVILGVFLLIVVQTTTLAQAQPPPPPYAGMKNPFPWTDAQAQSAGKKIYQQSCAACHGVNGGSLAKFDFSKPSYSKAMESKPDYYFWVLSEGRVNQGMPPYKSSLSEEQRWHLLTYIWALGTAPPPETAPISAPPSVPGGSFILTVPPPLKTGQSVTLSALLRDAQNIPVSQAEVKFLLDMDFFATSQMEIGEAVTGRDGIATIQYMPQRAGETDLIVKYGTIVASYPIDIAETGEVFYRTTVGIMPPSAGPEIFIGPGSSLELDEMGNAPNKALRLPGGALSWLLLFVIVLVLVWGIYFITLYQVLRISGVKESGTTGARPVPFVSLIIIFGLGLLMVTMVITGPHSHFHLSP